MRPAHLVLEFGLNKNINHLHPVAQPWEVIGNSLLLGPKLVWHFKKKLAPKSIPNDHTALNEFCPSMLSNQYRFLSSLEL